MIYHARPHEATKVNDGDRIAVWFSCGAASAVAAKRTLDLYGDRCSVRVLNNPVAEEDADNRRFLRDVQAWLGVEIEDVRNSEYPAASAVEVWNRRRGMSFPKGAPCTVELKKRARYEWEESNPVDWHVLGFVHGEEARHARLASLGEPLLPVLIEGGITKADCYRIVQDAGLALPLMYRLGYPNANCIGCVKATSPTYWNHVRRVHPDVFAVRAEQSRRLGVRLVRVNNVRIFLDELAPEATGAPLKNMQFECGLFCEEPREDAA
jgi:hypothetical protein